MLTNIPITIVDCNQLTAAGYVGQDVESCIDRLLAAANYNVSKAEHGIVVLDEFDKLSKKDLSGGTRDVGGEAVQQALLKLVEGHKVTVTVKEPRTGRSPLGSIAPSLPIKVEQYIVDTSNIMFVFCGAFIGLERIIMKRIQKKKGFGF